MNIKKINAAAAPAPQLRGEPCLTWARGEFRPALRVMGVPPRLGRDTYQSRSTDLVWSADGSSLEQFDGASSARMYLTELMLVTDPRHPEWAVLAEKATADYWAANAEAKQLLAEFSSDVNELNQALRLTKKAGTISEDDLILLKRLAWLASGMAQEKVSAMEAEYWPALERMCAALQAAEG